MGECTEIQIFWGELSLRCHQIHSCDTALYVMGVSPIGGTIEVYADRCV